MISAARNVDGVHGKVYILAKNEEANIVRCLDSVCHRGLNVTVLDSGSTDRTMEIAAAYPMVDIVPYAYKDHCSAYNEICTSSIEGDEYAVILDADMVVSDELWREVNCLIANEHWDVIRAPVQMFVEGKSLPSGSLYPPKPFAFKVGRVYFTPSGHGEKLAEDCRVADAKCRLIHDDRKGYEVYLLSQIRYARNLLSRARHEEVSVRDTIRLNTPLMMLVVPLFSYFIKLGLLSGKAGLIYAMDRLIAEAIMFRQSLAERL